MAATTKRHQPVAGQKFPGLTRRSLRGVIITLGGFLGAISISIFLFIVNRDGSLYIQYIQSIHDDAAWVNIKWIFLVFIILHYMRIFFGIAFVDFDVSFLEAKRNAYGNEIHGCDLYFVPAHLLITIFLPFSYVHFAPEWTASALFIQSILIVVYTLLLRKAFWAKDVDRKYNTVIFVSDLIFLFVSAYLFISILPNEWGWLSWFNKNVSPVEVFLIATGAFAFTSIFEIFTQYKNSLLLAMRLIYAGTKRFKSLDDGLRIIP